MDENVLRHTVMYITDGYFENLKLIYFQRYLYLSLGRIINLLKILHVLIYLCIHSDIGNNTIQ